MRSPMIRRTAEPCASRSRHRPALVGALYLLLILAWSDFVMAAPGGEASTDPAVTDNTGAARFEIPIQTPPGPGGLAPNLVLRYSSRRGDGPYGVGWDLGLGEIACSVRFGVPDYAYSNCKRFELDGQLLTRDGATNVYHSFVETFQRIEYSSTSQSWQVTHPNGTIFRYGLHPDSRVWAGPDIARWLLSEIEDPFGNQVLISYDDTTDPGTRYPLRITYGAGATKAYGKRSVDFVFGEDRPDPVHDYAGGIKRTISKRLTDIKVSSYGALVRRYAFGYELPRRRYTTGRTRLSWSQVFGEDCTGDITECSGLPRQEFEYTDSSDDGTTAQYSKFAKDRNYVIPFAGNWWVGATPVRIGDINGDGLPDLLKGGYTFGVATDETRVEINTGSGFVEDPAWTAALLGLEVERPRADFTQIKPDYSSGGGQDVFHYSSAGISEANYTIVKRPISDTPPAAMARPEGRYSGGAYANFPSGLPQPGWIEGLGRLFLTDVDADGLADIVVSVRLSGVDKVLNANGTPIAPTSVQREPGRVVQKVYRNTGDPALGWIEDDGLAAGLPPFGVVQFESGYGAESRIPFGPTTGWDIVTDINQPRLDPCSVRGLNGLWSGFDTPAHLVPDVCMNYVNLDPRFKDFNGDGYLDLMVLELDDPEALYQGFMDYSKSDYDRGSDAPPLPDNHARSVAWIQVPDAAAGEDRWIRAAAYDLPNVQFQSPGNGGHSTFAALLPFAHSQPHLLAGLTPPPNCPGPSDMPNWEFCSPLSHNTNLGVKFVDLNRDGLTDVIWSRYEDHLVTAWPGFPLIAQGVLLNTGTGWCSSVPEMAVHVESECADGAIYYPPENSYPTIPSEPSGFAFHDYVYTGTSTGQLADLNADGFLDYIQTHTDKAYPGNKAWLFNPAGATESPPNMWVRDARYDLDIDYFLIFEAYADALGFSVLDINGDGAADIVGDNLRDVGSADHPQAFISRSRHSDLLRLVRNGMGGTTAISYESPIRQRDPNQFGLEYAAAQHATMTDETLNGTTISDTIRWTTEAVVSAIRIAAPNREPDPLDPGSNFGPPTTYQYAHPRYCTKSRSDLGFRIVERTRPGGEVVTSRFYQVHGRAGRTSSVLVSDNGVDMHLYEEDWEIQPRVPAWIPGSIEHADVHVGRLAETRSMNLYANGATGAQLIRTRQYDDDYGYNFVKREVESRPTGTLVTLRVPDSDAPNSIFGLLREEKTFDHETASLADLDFLRHVSIGYQLGRASSLIERVKARGAAAPGIAETHTMTYDAHGNLTKQIVHAPTGDQMTDFCYDGDHGGGEDVGWCPDFGQDSHSVRVGLKDNLGGITTFRPDDGTGTILEIRSTYTDEPSRSVTLDAFGRPFESFVHDGTNWLRMAKSVYDDESTPPVVARTEYPAAGSDDADAIWSSVIGDGFGGTWKEIGKTPSGFAATLTYHDPAARIVRKSLPIECPRERCARLKGDIQPAATLIQVDAIGRPIRKDSPHGFSIYHHSSIIKTSGPGATGVAFDGVLEKNGKGDLLRRAVDGDRFGWIEECGNTVAATTTDIGPTPCGGPGRTQTFYTYEATGEISTIYDARAASPFNDPDHTLRYHYDTLGRVIQIDDPALAGSGHSLTSYDTYGNIQNITNARLQQRAHTYDRLNRLVGITTPVGETNYTLQYRQNEKRPGIDSSDDYQRTILFDELGRVQQEHMAVRNAYGSLQSFYTDYEYDLIGRVTEILHPARHYSIFGWKDTIVRYEYAGGYLDQVCELGDGTDCDSAATRFISAIEFDSLGRRQSLTIPGGVRTFQYTTDTHRLAEDRFDSTTYQYTRNYAAYDGVGNVLSITGSESATSALDMNETYVYDERNRIEQWTRAGTSYDYRYDDLGNLTLHADDAQVYDDPTRPHAIQRRDLTAATPTVYAYDDDGNVRSIQGTTSQYFDFDSANRLVCLSSKSTSCDTRVAYDVNGKRIAEYPSGGQAFNAYIGDAFLYQHAQVVAHAAIEIMLDGERIALKRFSPHLRRSTASLFAFHIPSPWLAGGAGCIGLLLILWGGRTGTLVLVEARPLRATTALAVASSLIFPSIATAAIPISNLAPTYSWEISDPLGTGMVSIDANGARIRHQVFTPFGRVHDQVGPNFRTFYAGHRRNDDTGLFYMQARWYDPSGARFLSLDLLLGAGSPQSHNPYSYVENNPINQFDPTGMFGEDAVELETAEDGPPNVGPMNTSTTTPTGTTTAKTTGGTPGSGPGVSDHEEITVTHHSNGFGGAPRSDPGGSGPATSSTRIANSLGGLASTPSAAGATSIFENLAVPIAGGAGGSSGLGKAPSGSVGSGGSGRGGPKMDSETQAMAVGLGALVRGPLSKISAGAPTFLGIMGLSAMIGGAALLVAGGALALGIGAGLGVSAAGLMLLGGGLMVIGGTQMALSRRMSAIKSGRGTP